VTPISGYVTTPDVQNLRGRYLQPGQRDLVTMVENTRILVAAIDVPEEDISGVAVGSEVTLYTWSYPGRQFKGSVSSIAPIASDDNPVGRSFVRVRTEIPNSEGLLKPKMTGYAKIRIEERPVWDILIRPLVRWVRIEVWSWLP
jgi:multidrug efflux pump subunit AcrA (membrane-fusion protein)